MCVCVHVRALTGGLVKMKRNPCQNRLYSRSLSPLLPSVVVFHKTARGGLRHFSLNRASERIWRITTYLLSWICISNNHRRARPSVTLRVWRSRSARINCTSTEQINRVACFTITYCGGCCCWGRFYFYLGQRFAAVSLLCLRESRENTLHKMKERGIACTRPISVTQNWAGLFFWRQVRICLSCNNLLLETCMSHLEWEAFLITSC